MSRFYEVDPTLENQWRAIVLFGRNVASYKFALAMSLLELGKRPNDLVKLEELAQPFSRQIREHLRNSEKQITSSSSTFLEACRKANAGELSEDRLLATTVKMGFNNVIDAFHVVNRLDIPKRFFIDERNTSSGIRLTDNFYKLGESVHAESLPQEAEARWRLVETAWQLSMAPSLLSGVTFDEANQLLFITDKQRRIDVTSSRDALNGYQKGRCFYCFAAISIESQSPLLADVDHFFPHILGTASIAQPINGVWNLVLACQNCNRGPRGKFERVPSLALLDRLSARNDYFIESHHPLRETLIVQTGSTPEMRRNFLQNTYTAAKTYLIHSWEPEPRAEALF